MQELSKNVTVLIFCIALSIIRVSSLLKFPASAPNDWKDIGVPVCIAAGSILFVFGAIFIVFRLISGGDIDRREREEERGLLNGGGIAGRNGDLNGPPADGDNLQSQPVSMTSTSDTYYDANDTSLTTYGSLPV